MRGFQTAQSPVTPDGRSPLGPHWWQPAPHTVAAFSVFLAFLVLKPSITTPFSLLPWTLFWEVVVGGYSLF